jgi:hypothetical protein
LTTRQGLALFEELYYTPHGSRSDSEKSTQPKNEGMAAPPFFRNIIT